VSITADDFRVARHAQELRAEAFTGGYQAETESYYGRGETGGHGVEVPLTWRAVLAERAAERRAAEEMRQAEQYVPRGEETIVSDRLDAIRDLSEPMARYFGAWGLCEQLEQALTQARALRVGALRQVRDETRLSQRELAAQVGVSPAMVNRLLNVKEGSL
jgi:hypothetical protein